MALNISDHADVYHVLFHTDNAKVTNSCQITTNTDSILVKPSYRKDTDDNLALKSKYSSINVNCDSKDDFFASMKIEFDCEFKEIFKDNIVSVHLCAMSNQATFIDTTIDCVLGETLTLAIARKDNKASIYKNGVKVNTKDVDMKGILSYISIDAKAKCLELQTILDDIIFIDKENVIDSNYTIDSSKSELANNAVVVDTNNQTFGTVAKV